MKTRTCGFCGRTIYDLSSVAMERVFACGGCRTRWTPKGVEAFVGEGEEGEGHWSEVPEGAMLVKERK